MAIKCIIHTADLHIRNIQRLEEYSVQLTNFIDSCRNITHSFDKNEVRIVIVGDLFHSKNNITAELYSITSAFIRQLEEIGKVIVIAGNHDLIVNNTTRKDALTGLFETAAFSNTYFLDYALDYQSGYVVDDNITWAVYSIYDNYTKPNLLEAREEKPNNKIIGLYHGMIVGAILNNGTVADCGLDGDMFHGCDCVMAGHIHKRQELKRGDVEIIYPSSLIQQSFGETITQHGYYVWNLDKMSHTFVEIPSEYSLYAFEISSMEDIDNDKEKLLNL